MIKQSFYEDLVTMTDKNQRYFGDWVNFEGYGDVGYYLGTKFVRFLLQDDEFDNVITYNLRKVKNEYIRFMNYSDLCFDTHTTAFYVNNSPFYSKIPK